MDRVKDVKIIIIRLFKKPIKSNRTKNNTAVERIKNFN